MVAIAKLRSASTDIVTVVAEFSGSQEAVIPFAVALATLLNCVVCVTLKEPAAKVIPVSPIISAHEPEPTLYCH